MKRKSSKIMSIFLVALFGCSTLAGCTKTEPITTGNQGQSEKEEKNDSLPEVGSAEPIRINVYKSQEPGMYKGPDHPHVQFIKERTGIEYHFERPSGDNLLQELNIRLASEDLADILRPAGGFEQTLIQQGGAVPLDDLLPIYAPNAWNSIPEEIWNIVRTASPDGKIYYIPQYWEFAERVSFIRQDWLDYLNLNMPTTQADYVEVLKAFRDRDPNQTGNKDTYPTTGREYGRWMDHLFAMYGVAMWEGYPEWDVYNGEVTYAGVTQNMKDAIVFASHLYQEKLLDNETFLNSSSVWTEKIASNRVGNWYHLPSNLPGRLVALTANAPDANVVGMPLPKVDGYDGFITMKRMGNIEWIIPKTSEEKAPYALQLMDFFYDQNPDEEKYEFLSYGIEGEHFVVENGTKVKLPIEDSTHVKLSMRNLATWEERKADIQMQHPEDIASKVIDAFIVAMEDGKTIASDGMPNSVYEGYPDIQSHKLFHEYMTKIIIGEWSVDKFDEFIERWYKTGGEEVTQRAREWYERTQQ